jgi:hypothetical protein
MPLKTIAAAFPILIAKLRSPVHTRLRGPSSRKRPSYELLESRTVLTGVAATYTWTALGDGMTWNDPKNWSHFDPFLKAQEPGVPVAFSNVVFPAITFLPKASPTAINFNFAYIFMPLNSLTINDSYTFSGTPITIEQSLNVSNSFTKAPGGTSANIQLAGLRLAPGATISTQTGSTLALGSTTATTSLQLTLQGALTKLGGGRLVIDTKSIFFPTTPTQLPVPVSIAGGSITFGASVSLNAINIQIASSASLNIADNVAAGFRSLTGTGMVDLEGTTAASDTTSLTVLVPVGTTDVFGGFIDGIGQFVMGGNGTLTTGTIDFGGAGSIEGLYGTLNVNGSISAGSLQVSPLGTFGGLGNWEFSGPVVFQSGATFLVTLNGLTPGTQYTQLVDTNATAGVNLGSSILAASIGYQYEDGDEFTIISAPLIQNGFQNVVAGRATLGSGVPFAVDVGATAVKIAPLASVTTTGLVGSANPSHPGMPVTFTATVNTRTAPVSIGTVSFLDGTTVLGTVPLGGGTASFTTTGLPLGVSPITAVYNGAGANLGSTSLTMAQSVVPYTTVTGLASAANPTAFGQPVIFTATVDSAAGPVTSGTVTFQRGNQTLGTVALSGSGAASLMVASLPVGTSRIQAIYSGSTGFLSSVSSIIKQSVTRITTATIGRITTMTMPNGKLRYVLIASVTTQGEAFVTPSGSVIFRRNGAVLGRAKVKNGTATLVLARNFRPKGKFVADFQGNQRFSPSKSRPFVFAA